MEITESALVFTTRVIYSHRDITNDLKVYWSQLLRFIYTSKFSAQQIRQKELLAATHQFKSKEEWTTEFELLPENDLILVHVFLRMILEQSRVFDQPVAAESLTSIMSALSQASEPFERLVEEKLIEYQRLYHRYENRKKIFVKASILPLTIDYFGRWLLLIFCQLKGTSTTYLLGYNFVASIVFLSLFFFISYRDRKHNLQLFTRHHAISDFKIKFQFSASQYTLIFLYGISSMLIGTVIDTTDDKTILLSDWIGNSATFVIYYLVVLRFAPWGRISEASLKRQIQPKDRSTYNLDADQNDEMLIQLETDISSKTSRLEAYVLESALFGALAFSGFLQIIATDLISFKDIETFTDIVSLSFITFLKFQWSEFGQAINNLNSKVNLFCLASIETLVCSGFFIAVIASRLRFSTIADRVKKALEVAKAFNTKEEVIRGIKKPSKELLDRLTGLNLKVNEQLVLAEKALEDINPIVRYMEYFRNGGLIMFFLVLISCSLFVTSLLGWLYIVVGGASWVYFNRGALNHTWKEVSLIIQIRFISRSYIYFLSALLLIIASFILRINFKVDHTNWLLSVSTSLVGIYIFLWFILIPKYDEQFGEITSDDPSQSQRWRTIQTVYAIAILIFFFVLSFTPFAKLSGSEFLILPLFMLFFLNFFIGFYCSKRRWIGILLSLITLINSLLLTGALLNNDFFFNNIMVIVLFSSSLIVYLITQIWSKSFHDILRRIYLTITIISLITLFQFLFKAPFPNSSIPTSFMLATMYEHKTYKMDSLKNSFNFELDSLKKIDRSLFIAKSEKYRIIYGTRNGWTKAYQAFTEALYFMADDYRNKFKENAKKDSSLLIKSIRFNEELRVAHKQFDFKYMDLRNGNSNQSDVLAQVGKKLEATEVLKEIINSKTDENVKRKMTEKLKAMEKAQ